MLIHIKGSTENNKGLVEKIQKGNPVTLLNRIWFDFLERAYIDKEIEICDCQKDKFFKLIKKSTDGISGIYAEFKSGQPTTDQVLDAVYGKGANSMFRVLLYDAAITDEDRDNPGADEIIVESLIDGMNQYGANIFLVKVGLDADGNIQCETNTGPSEIIEPSEAKIPPEEIVRQSEFWEVYYWSHWECFFKAHDCLSGNIHEHWNYGYKSHGSMISWCVKWDDSGIFYEIKNDDEDLDILEIIWAGKYSELQALFPKYKLEYVSKPGIPSKIRIKVNDLPITALLNASAPFKKEIAGKLLMELHGLDEFMEEAEDNVKNGNTREAIESGLLAEQG